jgi:hypothetical protein
MPQPVAPWIARFAQHLLQAEPELQPLDAVRGALAFTNAAQLPPEEAAEAYLSSGQLLRDQSRAGRGAGPAAHA